MIWGYGLRFDEYKLTLWCTGLFHVHEADTGTGSNCPAVEFLFVDPPCMQTLHFF